MQTAAAAVNHKAPALDFHRAVAPHLSELRRRAKSLVRVRADADDLLQETLLRGYRFWSTWSELEDRPGDPRPWLQTIMVSIWCNWSRRSKKRREIIEMFGGQRQRDRAGSVTAAPSASALASVGHHANVPATPADLVGGFSDELAAALDRINPTWRATFEESLTGATHQDIADKLQMPIGTVMSALYRARRALGQQPAVAALARNEYGMRAEFDTKSS